MGSFCFRRVETAPRYSSVSEVGQIVVIAFVLSHVAFHLEATAKILRDSFNCLREGRQDAEQSGEKRGTGWCEENVFSVVRCLGLGSHKASQEHLEFGFNVQKLAFESSARVGDAMKE